MHSAFFVWF